MKIKPIYAILIVLLTGSLVLVADYALEGGFSRSEYKRVSPGQDGRIHIGVADLPVDEARFFRFLNAGNQEVKFFVGRDTEGQLQVGFDASEICYKRKRGFTPEDGWMVCNTCDKSFHLTHINEDRGGCAPVALAHRVEGDQVVLTESDILQGWRFFR